MPLCRRFHLIGAPGRLRGGVATDSQIFKRLDSSISERSRLETGRHERLRSVLDPLERDRNESCPVSMLVIHK